MLLLQPQIQKDCNLYTASTVYPNCSLHLPYSHPVTHQDILYQIYFLFFTYMTNHKMSINLYFTIQKYSNYQTIQHYYKNNGSPVYLYSHNTLFSIQHASCTLLEICRLLFNLLNQLSNSGKLHEVECSSVKVNYNFNFFICATEEAHLAS